MGSCFCKPVSAIEQARDHLRLKIPELEKKRSEIIEELYLCNCCKRHQKGKPINIEDSEWYDHQKIPILKNEDLLICSCECRHFSRRLQWEYCS